MGKPGWFLAGAIAVVVVVLLIRFLGRPDRAATTGLPVARVVLDGHDRVLVLAPHPDDEVLGCGGIIQQAVAMGLPVHIAFLTYGDFYEWSFMVYKKRLVLTAKGVEGMGEVRHDEAVAAAAVLGLSKNDLSFFGYPDFRTLEIWRSAWGQSPPVQGLLTRARAVPYSNAVRPGAPYKAEEVLADLTTLIRDFRPTKVFVSHPADHHPDHRALYLFTRVCLFDLESELSPELHSYLVHYTDWPAPKGYHSDRAMRPPVPLAAQISWSIDPLTPRQVGTKWAALREHRSQLKATPRYLRSFVRTNELFGDFPPVELHAGGASCSVSGEMSDDCMTEGQIVGREEAVLVGIVNKIVRVENLEFVLSLDMGRPLAREVGLSVYLFGYRRDRPFSTMPKLYVKLGVVHHELYDQDRRLAAEAIGVTRAGRHIDVRVPLALIGDPQRLFASVQTEAGAIPLAWSAWRVFEIHSAAASQDGSVPSAGAAPDGESR